LGRLKNVVVFLALCAILAVAMIIGMNRSTPGPSKAAAPVQVAESGIPSVGRVQLLNGCGAVGAANKVADFLRAKGFDVKQIGNAPTANYPSTLVVSRTKDMSVARQVAAALGTDKVVLMRAGDETYDVTVFIGPDYPERTTRK